MLDLQFMEKTAAKYLSHLSHRLDISNVEDASGPRLPIDITLENFQEGSQKEDFSKNNPQNSDFLFNRGTFLQGTKTFYPEALKSYP